MEEDGGVTRLEFTYFFQLALWLITQWIWYRCKKYHYYVLLIPSRLCSYKTETQIKARPPLIDAETLIKVSNFSRHILGVNEV